MIKLIVTYNFANLQKVVGNQPFSLEALVSKGRVWQNKECDFDKLGQLLLNHNVYHPCGNSFIQKDSLGFSPGIPRQ